MTRKDYQLIADVLRFGIDIEDETEVAVRDCLANDFAYKLAQTNPHFNRERFLKAAGVNEFTTSTPSTPQRKPSAEALAAKADLDEVDARLAKYERSHS